MKIEKGAYVKYREFSIRFVVNGMMCERFIEINFWKWFITFNF